MRALWPPAGWIVICAVLFSGGSALAADSKELVIVATGGAFEKALRENFYVPFTKATGITVRAVPASNAEQWAKVKAMTAAGRMDWDIVTIYPEDMISQKAVLSPLDCAALAALKDQAIDGACKDRGLIRTLGGGVLAFNSKALGAATLETWADFWNVKDFPGPRALPNYGAPWWVLMAALEADGVPADKLFPLDLDRAFRKLDQIKPEVKVWWKTGDQSQQIMRDGEVVMSMMWSGRAYELAGQGLPIGVSWQGAPVNVAMWGILKDARHADAANAFLDFFLGRPEAHVAFSREIAYDTANRKALELLPEAERRKRTIYPANAEAMAPIDEVWVAENRAELIERWNDWLAK